jgi:PAS domain S-box-containing protein
MEEDLQKLASVVRHSSELVNLATIDGKMIFLNEAGGKMLGIDPREVQRVNIMQVIPDHLKKKVETELLPALMSGGTWEGDLQYRNLKTGQLTEVHATTFTIKDPTTRTPLYLANVSLDITERKHAEEALRESEGRYRILFDSASDAIFIHDMGEKFLEVNQVACDRLGYSREELLQMTPADIDSPEYAPQVAKRTAEIREKGHAIFKTTHIRRDGTAVPAELSSRLIEYKGKPAVLSIARDITARVKYEEKLVALHKHASQLAGAKSIEEIIESTLDAMQIALGFDIADVFVIRDGQMESKGVRGMPLGFSGPVPYGRGIVWKVVNSKATVRVGDVRTETAYLDRFGPDWEGPPSMSSEMAVPVIVDDKTAAVLNVESTRLDAFTDEDQKLLETLAVHVGSDIRRLKSDEELRRYSAQLEELVTERTAALRAARERLEYVIASNPAVIYAGKPLADHSDFFLTYLSERVVSMLGFEPREFVGHPEFWERHVPPEDMRSVMAEMPRLWKEGHRTFEYRFLHRDGTYRWIREEAKVVRDADGNPIEVNGYWIDVSERKHLEEALLRVERLAAIGETARMIGHDLRNPLQGISGATAVLRQHFGQRTDEITLEMLQTIDGCVKYANGIVSDLLDYTREIQLDLTKTNPKHVVNDVLSLIRLPSNIRLLDLTESKPEIELDLEKIQRVFMNIIDNAIAAMPKGGKMIIKSKVRKENLELQFTDTGEGISKKEMKMIWKPFHTTKAKGIGLGLAICKRIVEAHAGSISATSTVRKGTTFLIKLPIEPLLKRTKT